MIRKYYEYEGLGGGIDPKSTSKAQPMTQTMTKERILCNKKWINPSGREMIIYMEAMEEYANQEVAKEREKAKKLVEALDVIYKNTQDKLIYDIAKQSLTEYGV